MPTLRLCEFQFHVLRLHTRLPFRYGITSLTEVPHLFVSAVLEIDGRPTQGWSAETLAPKWFTKDADSDYEREELPMMLAVIRHAATTARDLGQQPSFFTWWKQLYEMQVEWAAGQSIAPLLAGLGSSLIERAAIDACARCLNSSLFELLRQNALQIDMGALRPALSGVEPCQVLPPRPSPNVRLRHTIGLADPLTRDNLEIPDPQDGLPLTLFENIQAYDLDHFKIKLSGDVGSDRTRLAAIIDVLAAAHVVHPRVTLDGNENFQDIAEFRSAFESLRGDRSIREFLERSLLFVEQPLRRDKALDVSVADAFRNWPTAPPLIIDESDDSLDSLPQALGLGYRGTSHKNCKGIIKGLLAAATIAQASTAGQPLLLSAEDLATIGPVGLLQDLAMVAALGIPHVERNGHHYFAGMHQFPNAIQLELLHYHSDLYARRGNMIALCPKAGRLSLASVNRGPFGVRIPLDLSDFRN